jgi:hypothetical protein
MVAAFIAVRMIASLSGKLRSVFAVGLAPPGASADREASHISGSFTLRRIQSVKSAGMMPTKNTARQPKRGSTIAVTIAARP